MASPTILDFEALLAPISADNPAGTDIRYEGIYDAIRQARRADDTLPQGEWVREVKTADWSAVIDLASQALQTQSKDLQLGVWLVEALVRRHGFAGVRDGLHLLWELQERFWEDLYPEIEDGDLEYRAAPLEWLNTNLAQSIRQLPMTQGMNGERYTWFLWKESRDIDNLGRRNTEAMDAAMREGKLTGAMFDKAVETTSVAFYQTLFEDLNQIWEEYSRLDQMVDEKFGQQGPALLEIRKAVEDCRALVEGDITKKKGQLGSESEASDTSALTDVATEPEPSSFRVATVAQTMTLSGAPQNRAEALRLLSVVADYFRQAEPHSPVSYLVQRAVRWGEMPLETWLRDVIHDENVLSSILETLGITDADAESQA
jgi:type VI secretion system protein ImpA